MSTGESVSMTFDLYSPWQFRLCFLRKSSIPAFKVIPTPTHQDFG